MLGVNLFKLLAHLKELHVPVLKDTLTYGAIHRAWYYQHPMIVVHDPDELANVRISVVVVFFFSYLIAKLLGKSVDIFDRSQHEMEGFKVFALHFATMVGYSCATKELLGEGMLLVPNGSRWKKAREMRTRTTYIQAS